MKTIYVFIIFLLSSLSVFAQFSGGSGTQSDPYQIANLNDLVKLRDDVNSGNTYKNTYFIMTNDIDMKNIHNWKPTSFDTEIYLYDSTYLDSIKLIFDGKFDGKNYTINNFNIDIIGTNETSQQSSYLGLFGFTGKNSIVKNLNINGSISLKHINYQHICLGSIASINLGTIDSCNANVSIYVEDMVGYSNISGICGENLGSIQNCKNLGEITINSKINWSNIGGVAGTNGVGGILRTKISKCKIINSHNTGNILVEGEGDVVGVGEYTGLGGVVGRLVGDVINCSNTGNITVKENGETDSWGFVIGGIAGSSESNTSGTIEEDDCKNISGCYNSGNIFTNNNKGNSGGIIGIHSGYINNCYNAGKIEGRDPGGIISTPVGEFCSINNCYNAGEIVRNGGAAGIVGGLNGNTLVSISNCYNVGIIQTYNSIHSFAIIGNNPFDKPVTITNCYYLDLSAPKGNFTGNETGITKMTEQQMKNFSFVGMINNGQQPEPWFQDITPFKNNGYPVLSLTHISGGVIKSSASKGGTITPEGNVIISMCATEETVFVIKPENCYKISDVLVDGVSIGVADIYSFPAGKVGTIHVDFVRDSFNLTLLPEPVEGGSASISGRYACGNKIKIEAIANNEYLFINWTDEAGNVISVNAIDSVTIIKDSVLIANFEASPMPSATFIIRASEHKLVSPNAANYEIPIYITADKDVAASNLYINKLVIEMDRNIYSPTNATSTIANNMRNIALTNIQLPELVEGKEALLCKLKGDVLLGDIDSSSIVIKEVNFSDNIKLEQLDTINGYITLDICREGGERLIDVLPYSPSIRVVKNPVTSELEVTCRTIELGNYELNIIDLQGNISSLKAFKMSNKDEHTHSFKFSTTGLGNGSYIIEMLTPSEQKFTDKFVVAK